MAGKPSDVVKKAGVVDAVRGLFPKKVKEGPRIQAERCVLEKWFRTGNQLSTKECPQCREVLSLASKLSLTKVPEVLGTRTTSRLAYFRRNRLSFT